ncbi:S8 family serine peptidase [Mycoplasma sp. 5370]
MSLKLLNDVVGMLNIPTVLVAQNQENQNINYRVLLENFDKIDLNDFAKEKEINSFNLSITFEENSKEEIKDLLLKTKKIIEINFRKYFNLVFFKLELNKNSLSDIIFIISNPKVIKLKFFNLKNKLIVEEGLTSSYDNASKNENNSTEDFLIKQKETIHFEKSNGDETDKQPIKIGVMEVDSTPYYKHFKNIVYFDKDDKGTEYSHADSVARIIADKKYGLNPNSIIYAANFKGDENENEFSKWIKRMEWMIDNGVKIINHSYGRIFYKNGQNIYKDVNDFLKNQYYNDYSYYLDFITKKYGIINVFSSGNDGENKDFHFVDGTKLSQNSVIVGSTNIEGDSVSTFSSWGHASDIIFNKPLVVAPGENYKFKSENSFSSGTSFSSPLVTGVLANIIMNNNSDLINKPESILSILGSGSYWNSKNKYEKSFVHNFNKKYGIGLIDYQKIKRATKNLYSFSLAEFFKEKIFNINLKKDDNVSISIAWLFNAGYEEEKIKEPIQPLRPSDYYTPPKKEEVNFFLKLFNPFLIIDELEYLKKFKEWENMKKEFDEKYSLYLKKKEEYNLQTNNNLINKFSILKKYKNYWNSSDYEKLKNSNPWFIPKDVDIDLEFFNKKTNKWEVVASSRNIYTNIEFINFKVLSDGEYRIKVYIPDQSPMKEIVKGMLSYVIN